MKTRFLPLILFAAALVAGQPLVAQQRPAPPGYPAPYLEPQSRLEQFLATPNQLLTRDYYRVEDRLGSTTTMQAMVASLAGQPGTRVRGLRVDIHDRSAQAERAGTSFVDLEELEPLSRALGSLTDLSATWKGQGQEAQVTEVQFTTIGGFSVGLHQDWQAQHAFVSSGFLDPVRVRIEVSDFYKAKGMVDQAFAILQRK